MSKFDSKIYERDIYEDSMYSAWLKYSNERDILEEVLKKNKDLWVKKNSISILEFGCGTGSAAKRIFNILNSEGISYEYTGVDPYQDQLDRWSEWLPKGQKVSLVKGTIEDFRSSEKYDLVLAVHSLYYVNDIGEALRSIKNFGKNAIIVHHGMKGINEVHEAFRSFVKLGPNIISTYKEVKQELDAEQIPYFFEVAMSRVDIRACQNPNNEDGKKLIKFFLEHSELSEKIIVEVRTFLRTKGDFMEQYVGYFFL
ncbi:MAG TPA: class I SAM-dependent methyltransferase [Candidatus Paceibacterota bacterium]|nr:class I SAM-dependent methyltransferase [Candidatus Paceibacterota bacterium]